MLRFAARSDNGDRMPIRGPAPDCCPRAASGHAAAVPPSAAINSRRRIWIAMRPSHGGHATGEDGITPGLAALRDFKPVYVGSGSRPCENVFRQGSGATLMQICALGHILDSPEQRVRFFCYARVILFRVFTQSGSQPELTSDGLMSATTGCGHHAPALTRLPARPA